MVLLSGETSVNGKEDNNYRDDRDVSGNVKSANYFPPEEDIKAKLVTFFRQEAREKDLTPYKLSAEIESKIPEIGRNKIRRWSDPAQTDVPKVTDLAMLAKFYGMSLASFLINKLNCTVSEAEDLESRLQNASTAELANIVAISSQLLAERLKGQSDKRQSTISGDLLNRLQKAFIYVLTKRNFSLVDCAGMTNIPLETLHHIRNNVDGIEISENTLYTIAWFMVEYLDRRKLTTLQSTWDAKLGNCYEQIIKLIEDLILEYEEISK